MVEKILKKHLVPADNYIYGFANLSGLLDKKFTGFNYGISIAKKLDNDIIEKIKDGPTSEYYAHYKSINEELAVLTKEISADLNKNNIITKNIEPTVSTSDLDTIYYKSLRTDISHKMVATRAGMGWIGKSDLFISKKFGPRLRLVTILIKNPLPQKMEPVNISRCGTCNICVETCPAKAANGKLWNILVEREDFFNPWKCREQCAEFGRERLGINARICGICVAICPVGQGKPVN